MNTSSKYNTVTILICFHLILQSNHKLYSEHVGNITDTFFLAPVGYIFLDVPINQHICLENWQYDKDGVLQL